ncbi:AAA family ATPase [Prevotella nigrescens]|uniref:AAA family ATPase n=1 Tax=Prevotella nigrescens TaxID=28133 RepID=UPI00021820C8|nr:ATP-binding protein [Prevotella nigrescens]EGQ14028.1 ATPase [Prevotella nigrescens ATCC 33563]UAK28525.1 AAA family ATPase [Prevotella nigrescens]WMS22370.1 ATP-binding protein [Prevotella nigrescens]SUB93207.1 Predicted ATPase (AAA+ superfamily) [Prevotella nigrescens]
MCKKFVYGVAVSDYNFIGRERETKRLLDNFKGGINVILMSPRRLGKTSLVKHVCNKLDNKDIITVYLDIFGCKSEYDFYNKLTAEVLKQTASKSELWFEEAKEFLYRLTPKISFSPEPNSDFSISLGITPKTHTPEEVLQMAETIAIKRKKRIVICIDEFQQIGEMSNSKQIQARLRTVWQHQKHVSYCLFGSKHHLMSTIFLHRSMPFFQFGDTISLNKIATEDWVEYIVSHFADGKRTISHALAEEICKFTENYSAYVQQLAWLVFTLKEEGETVTEDDVRQAKNDLLATNDILFMQMIEPLSEFQLNFLRAIALGIKKDFGLSEVREEYNLGSYSNITRLKTALLERDLIEKQNTGLVITDPIFAKWLKRKIML